MTISNVSGGQRFNPIAPIEGPGAQPGQGGIQEAGRNVFEMLKNGPEAALQNPDALKDGLSQLLEALTGGAEEAGASSGASKQPGGQDLLKALIPLLKQLQEALGGGGAEGPGGPGGPSDPGAAPEGPGKSGPMDVLKELLPQLLEQLEGLEQEQPPGPRMPHDEYTNERSPDMMGDQQGAGCIACALGAGGEAPAM